MPSRARKQTVARRGHVGYIVKKIAQKLSSKEDHKRMLTTNRLIPLGSFKRACVKRIFNGWVKKKFLGTGRVITKKLTTEVVRRLRSKLELPPCHDIKDEVARMQYLLKVARKRLGGKKSDMSTVDMLDTLPMDEFGQHPQEDFPGQAEDWYVFFWPLSFMQFGLYMLTSKSPTDY